MCAGLATGPSTGLGPGYLNGSFAQAVAFIGAGDPAPRHSPKHGILQSSVIALSAHGRIICCIITIAVFEGICDCSPAGTHASVGTISIWANRPTADYMEIIGAWLHGTS